MAAPDIRLSNFASDLALPVPAFIPRRYQPGSLANWSGHLSFANDLIADLKPSLLVELGTHYGESYFGLCQSVQENEADCLCYAVDHWLGEEHAGTYGEEVFTEVNAYNERFYRSFSYLLRSSFDDALDRFSNESIGLIHIDGLHTYEAGSHDFEAWLPKVRPGGIVLLHDVVVRHANFGIWKLWEELTSRFAETFTFHHSWGLGVLRKPGGDSRNQHFLNYLFNASGDTPENIRRHYVVYSSHLDRLLSASRVLEDTKTPQTTTLETNPPNEDVFLQVFLPDHEGYSERFSLREQLAADTWMYLRFDLPSGVEGSIRVDPSDRPCVLQINALKLIDVDTGDAIWEAQTASALKSLLVAKSALFLPQDSGCFLFSYGSDPQIFLPPQTYTGHARLEVSLRLYSDFTLLIDALNRPVEPEISAPVLVAQAPTLARNATAVKIYPVIEGRYQEERSISRDVEVGLWHTVVFDLEPESLGGPLRLDPADTVCLVELGGIRIVELDTGDVLVNLRSDSELTQLQILDAAIFLPQQDRSILFCYGPDPRLLLPLIRQSSSAVRVEVSLRLDTSFETVASLIGSPEKVESAESQSSLKAEIETLKAELRASHSSRLLLTAELSQLANEKDSKIRQKDFELKQAQAHTSQLETLNESRLKEFLEISESAKTLQAGLDQSQQILKQTIDEKVHFRNLLALEEQRSSGLLASLSWRITKPLRGVAARFRGN